MVGRQILLPEVRWEFLHEYTFPCAGGILGFVANPWWEQSRVFLLSLTLGWQLLPTTGCPTVLCPHGSHSKDREGNRCSSSHLKNASSFSVGKTTAIVWTQQKHNSEVIVPWTLPFRVFIYLLLTSLFNYSVIKVSSQHRLDCVGSYTQVFDIISCCLW